MTIHKMKLASAPFEKIANSKKVIESRLYDEKRRQINPGDQIEFSSNNDPSRKITTSVCALYLYPDFKSLFLDFPPLYFGGNSREELLEEIENFYSEDEQTKFGVIGIKIELIK